MGSRVVHWGEGEIVSLLGAPGSGRCADLATGAVDAEVSGMFLILAVLLLAILFGAVGFAVHVLWIVAVIAFVLWLLGFLVRSSGGRWYRW
ncbi:MAG: hypothetical protein JWM85_1604 [Acidimicrobiaceae bacterium]|nr:hypothetical protein [Acidimicrobiaceae bacterium]